MTNTKQSGSAKLDPHHGSLHLGAVTAIGIGGMIGGGIFAVLGLAISVSGHAVVLTLAGGGVIALITGISYSKLGLTFRDAGGSFTYIDRAFPRFVGGLAGWLLVVGYIGTLALYATAFGDYGATMIQGGHFAHWLSRVLAASALLLFLSINLLGAKISGGVELIVVAVKVGLLALFAGFGFIGLHLAHFQPFFNQGVLPPFVAIALIFVAYEGFELIPNAVADMRRPERDLPRALVLSILIAATIYVLVAVAAVGNLTVAQIQKDQEYVLAVAAKPHLGQTGFLLIGIAAVLSTASAINATLFGASRLARVMATERALPKFFSRETRDRPVPWVALLVLTLLSLTLAVGARLDSISVFASATFLLIFSGVNLAAFRLARRIGSTRWLPMTGFVLSGVSFCALVWRTAEKDRMSLYVLCGIYAAAVLLQWRFGGDRPKRAPHVPAG